MSEYSDALDRLCLLEKDVFSTTQYTGLVDAVPVSVYTQEALPYWTNDTTGFRVELESQSVQIIRYQLLMTLVLSPVRSGFEDEAEEQILTYLPLVLQYMGQRRQMRRNQLDAAVDFLYPEGMLITGGRAERRSVSGIGQIMNIIEFDAEIPMYQNTDQVVF